MESKSVFEKVVHLLLWAFSVFAIATYFSISNSLDWIDFFYSFLFHLVLVPLVYANILILIPQFWARGKFLLYFVGSAILIFFSWLLHILLFDQVLPSIQSYFFIVSFTEVRILVNIFLIYQAVSTLIFLSQSWFTLKNVEKEKLQMELMALRNQLNPHFLFNGLNSIYGLSLKNDKKASDAILRLSDLLRYVLYDVNEEMIELEKEVQQIKNYISIQSLRVGNKVSVSFDHNNPRKSKIHPMILLPIVENAFKHGPNGTDGGFINFKLTLEPEYLLFSSKNTIGYSSGSEGGIGLANLKSRLIALYSDHVLEISEINDEFELNLKINFR